MPTSWRPLRSPPGAYATTLPGTRVHRARHHTRRPDVPRFARRSRQSWPQRTGHTHLRLRRLDRGELVDPRGDARQVAAPDADLRDLQRRRSSASLDADPGVTRGVPGATRPRERESTGSWTPSRWSAASTPRRPSSWRAPAPWRRICAPGPGVWASVRLSFPGFVDAAALLATSGVVVQLSVWRTAPTPCSTPALQGWVCPRPRWAATGDSAGALPGGSRVDGRRGRNHPHPRRWTSSPSSGPGRVAYSGGHDRSGSRTPPGRVIA